MTLVQTEPKKIYIRVKAWWKTWANTIAYFPLEDDTLDVMGNYSFSVTWTKQTIWYSFTDTNRVDIIWTQTPVNFISYYYKRLSVSGSNRFIGLINEGGMRFYSYNRNAGFNRFRFYNSSDTAYTSTEWPDSTDVRQHLAYGVDSNGNYAAYVNWSLFWSWTQTPQTNSNYVVWLVVPYNEVAFSDILVESAPRSAQEISDYYNDTKAIYWL